MEKRAIVEHVQPPPHPLPRVCQSVMDLSFMGVSLTMETVPPMLTRRSWLERIQA